MKKHDKQRGPRVLSGIKFDVSGAIGLIQQQLVSLEQKLDKLISESAGRSFEKKDFSRPFNRFDRPQRHGYGRQGDNFKNRNLFKAVCAECNQECEIPFKPRGDRPVYCRDCFSKRKERAPFREERSNDFKRKGFSRDSNFDKRGGVGIKKFGKMKKFGKSKKSHKS